MKYTIRDILLGKERKWLSENIQYKRDDNYKNGIFPYQYTEKIKSEINNTDIQNIYISKIESLKNNNEMKEKFYIFLKELLATYNKKEQSYYLLETSPLLLFFADKNRGPRTGNDIVNDKINPNDTPIDVVSILTGERLKFASFRDMKMKIDNNIMLKVWFKNHFNNYSDPNFSTMKLIKKERDYSYLYENILQFNIEKADVLVRSPNEALLFELFERFKDIAVYFSPPSILIGSITGVAYQSILAASPSFFQAAISDTSDEYYIYLKEEIINIVAELLGEALSEVTSKTLAKSIKLYLKNKFIKKSLHISDSIKNFSKNNQLQQNSKILKLEPNELENRFEIQMLSRINPDNLTNDIPSLEYLTQLKTDDTINKKITSPIGQCESLMEPVANFMINHDMTNIKYRGIYIWDDATDEMPLNHFVVLGKKNDKNYVFDLTAHQFSNEGMPSLNAPLILEETEWEKRYISAATNRLIKYKDFNNASRASDVYNAYPGHAPNEIIDGEKILITPPWYRMIVKKDINQNDLIELPDNDSNTTPTIRDQIYQIATTDLQVKDNFTFTAEILQHSGLINEAQKTKLIDRLKNISQQAGSSRYEQLNELIEQAHQITTIDQLLQLKKGELVVFSDNDPELVVKNKPLVHTMVSLGNGRFTTMASNELDPSLDDGMQFLMAEQLIPLITGKTLKLLNSLTIPKYSVSAGYPKDSAEQYPSLLTTVYKFLADGGKIKNLSSFISLIIQKAGELSPEQALIFSDTIETLRDSNNSKTTINDVITNKEKISDVNQLTALSSGTLVIFHKTDYQVSDIMMSVGKKGFITLFSEHLGKTSKYNNELISPSQFNNVFNNKSADQQVTVGQINLKSMRQSALLGKGSLFTVDGNKLLIKAQGAPSIVNDIDALELANVIKGLSMQETNPIDLQKIDTIELQSCFSAFGSQSLGQKLANIFDKKVIAYPFSMIKTFEDPKQEWMTKPKIYEPNKLVLTDEQHIKNNKFYNELAGLYQNQKIISIKAERQLNLPKPEYLLIQLIYDSARLILKKINEEDFLELHPEYISHDGRIYPQALMELKSLIRSFTSQEMTQQNFIELIIEILSLSHSSFDLLNQLLSKEEHW